MKRLPILLSLLALVALAASIAYWVLQLYQPPQRPLAAAPQAALPEPSIDAAATLFGGQAAAAVATNYTLTGVVAAGGDSVAIIVAEGSPPKALKIGKEVVPGVTVSEVHPRYVMLSDSGVMKRIDLAPDTKAAAPMGGQPPGGSAPPGEPQISPGPVQTQEAPQPEVAPPPAAPVPVPAPVPAQPAQPAPTAAMPAPGTVTATSPGAAPSAMPSPPPPAPVQMPPPLRSGGQVRPNTQAQ